jgi:hypothetical protein
MIWLKGLEKIKEELRNERWPRSAQEGFYTGIVLMAYALEDFKSNIKKSMPGANDKKIQSEFRKMLLRFNKIDSRWIESYKREHEKNNSR